MINANMKNYDYYTYERINNSYGQPDLSEVKGQIKIAIHLTSETVGGNSLYSDAQYIGLTFDSGVSTRFVIQYGTEKLKVLYVIPTGRYKTVFLARM